MLKFLEQTDAEIKREQVSLKDEQSNLEAQLQGEKLSKGKIRLDEWRKQGYGLAIPSLVKEYLKQAVAAKVNHELLMQMPIFGIAFHVNDLGIIGGFGLLVLLLWMRVAVDGEIGCLREVLRQTKRFAEGVPPGDTRIQVSY